MSNNYRNIIILVVLFLLMVFSFKNIFPLLIIVGIIYALLKKSNVNINDWFKSQLNFRTKNSPINLNNLSNMQTLNTGSVKKMIIWAVVGMVVLILVAKSLVVVPAGYVGVYHLFGKVSDRALYSGLHLVNPLGAVEKMSVRTEDYTMSITSNEGRRSGDDSITALTKEGLSVSLDITVLYHLVADRAPEVYKNIGLSYSEIVIRPEIRSAIRDITADYTAKEIYSEKRAEANAKLVERLKTKIETRGILLEEVLLRNVNLPTQLAQSIEQKLQAEQESQRYDFVLQKETKEAERKRIEAEGQRNAQKIISESLTFNYLNYLYLQGIKDRPGTIYVPVNPNNGLPLFKGL